MLLGIDASRIELTDKTGVEWYSYYLIQELKKIIPPLETKVILYSRHSLSHLLEPLPPYFQNKVLAWFPYLWTQLRLSWEMMVRPPDILFIPSHLIPLVHPSRVMISWHDIGFYHYPQFYSLKERLYLTWGIKYALGHATKIIVPSHFTKQEMIQVYGLNPEKAVVIPLGLDHQLYRMIDEQGAIKKVLSKYQLTQPYLLYLGRLETKKNLITLLKAYLKMKTNSVKLVLAGKLGFGYEKIQAFIKAHQLTQRVVELGWIAEEDLPYLMNGAEIFVFPSFYEGFGLPVLEAMACGTPVIASRASALPEVAGEAAVLVEPRDERRWAEAIQQLLDNKDLRNQWSQKGLKRAQTFSWQECAKRVWGVIETIR